MSALKVTLIQTKLHWEDKAANLSMFSEKIAGISSPTDLIVLPEMFTTGFSMNSENLGEGMDGPAVVWMKKTAAGKNAVITGSFICSEGGKHFNRLVWMRPDGTYQYYDKRHLFRMGNEQNHYSGGSRRIITEIKGWKVCPLICYDLRFPAWCRNLDLEGKGHAPVYDLLIFAANWPERRSYAWKSLLRARAIENLSYTIGVNRVGKDGKGVDHSGDSALIDFKGECISSLAAGSEGIEILELDRNKQEDFRKQFPAALDADTIIIPS